MFTDNYDSSFCFWVFEKRLTQENCFLFCKKYGLFDGFILFLTIKKFLLSYFPNFHGQRSGGTRSEYLIPEAELFQPWRGSVQRTYTQTVLLEMSCEISGQCFFTLISVGRGGIMAPYSFSSISPERLELRP